MERALQKLVTAMAALSFLGLGACSNQWYEVNPGANEDEIVETINRIQSQTGTQAFDASLLADLNSDGGKTVYFLKSGGSGLLPEAVMSLRDVSPFLGGTATNNGLGVFGVGLSEVSVAFIDALSSDNTRYFALMLEMKTDAGTQYFVGISNPQDYAFSDNEFAVSFSGQNGQTVVLRTYDVDPDFSEALGANVAFQVYVLDQAGNEISIGHFAPLAGFGG